MPKMVSAHGVPPCPSFFIYLAGLLWSLARLVDGIFRTRFLQFATLTISGDFNTLGWLPRLHLEPRFYYFDASPNHPADCART